MPLDSNRAYEDVDAAPSRTYMIEHRDDPAVARLFTLAYRKRPAEQPYDLREDPDQLDNVVDKPECVTTRSKLASTLRDELTATGDPRMLNGGDAVDNYPYYGGRQPRKR
jgi:hypothetical protein